MPIVPFEQRPLSLDVPSAPNDVANAGMVGTAVSQLGSTVVDLSHSIAVSLNKSEAERLTLEAKTKQALQLEELQATVNLYSESGYALKTKTVVGADGKSSIVRTDEYERNPDDSAMTTAQKFHEGAKRIFDETYRSMPTKIAQDEYASTMMPIINSKIRDVNNEGLIAREKSGVDSIKKIADANAQVLIAFPESSAAKVLDSLGDVNAAGQATVHNKILSPTVSAANTSIRKSDMAKDWFMSNYLYYDNLIDTKAIAADPEQFAYHVRRIQDMREMLAGEMSEDSQFNLIPGSVTTMRDRDKQRMEEIARMERNRAEGKPSGQLNPLNDTPNNVLFADDKLALMAKFDSLIQKLKGKKGSTHSAYLDMAGQVAAKYRANIEMGAGQRAEIKKTQESITVGVLKNLKEHQGESLKLVDSIQAVASMPAGEAIGRIINRQGGLRGMPYDAGVRMQSIIQKASDEAVADTMEKFKQILGPNFPGMDELEGVGPSGISGKISKEIQEELDKTLDSHTTDKLNDPGKLSAVYDKNKFSKALRYSPASPEEALAMKTNERISANQFRQQMIDEFTTGHGGKARGHLPETFSFGGKEFDKRTKEYFQPEGNSDKRMAIVIDDLKSMPTQHAMVLAKAGERGSGKKDLQALVILAQSVDDAQAKAVIATHFARSTDFLKGLKTTEAFDKADVDKSVEKGINANLRAHLATPSSGMQYAADAKNAEIEIIRGTAYRYAAMGKSASEAADMAIKAVLLTPNRHVFTQRSGEDAIIPSTIINRNTNTVENITADDVKYAQRMGASLSRSPEILGAWLGKDVIITGKNPNGVDISFAEFSKSQKNGMFLSPDASVGGFRVVGVFRDANGREVDRFYMHGKTDTGEDVPIVLPFKRVAGSGKAYLYPNSIELSPVDKALVQKVHEVEQQTLSPVEKITEEVKAAGRGLVDVKKGAEVPFAGFQTDEAYQKTKEVSQKEQRKEALTKQKEMEEANKAQKQAIAAQKAKDEALKKKYEENKKKKAEESKNKHIRAIQETAKDKNKNWSR